ncbi:hypothetical protein HMPREF0654_09670 [Prevotella disiens DNF00882]|uniref:Uncharacterized protein n=1 Tax=Prevotella disiens DNF00882 TaxID=1401075 RepID=A0A096BYM6_9BACT|nr:hypothetical protein HMPREF0654_09670 [Prevotella disiens DNF00882]
MVISVTINERNSHISIVFITEAKIKNKFETCKFFIFYFLAKTLYLMKKRTENNKGNIYT